MSPRHSSLNGLPKRRYWTPAEVRKLRRLYPDMDNGAVGERLARSWSAVQNMAVKLHLRKSAAFMASPACRFQRGMRPWNLGVTGYMGANRTSFRRGQKPASWRPVGSERINKDGHVERKVREPRKWRTVHAINWEAVHGNVKPGYIVAFKVGTNKLDPGIANLECISRAENMRRNTYHRYPKEIARLIQLRGALNRQINRRERDEEQNRGSEKPPVRDNRKGQGRRHAARPGKGRRRTGASRHQQRQGGKRLYQGRGSEPRNRVYH